MIFEVRSNEKDLERFARLIGMQREWAWLVISNKYGCALGSVQCVLFEIYVKKFKDSTAEMGFPYNVMFGYAIEDH